MKLEPATPAATVEPLSPNRQRLAALQSDLASVDSAVADQLALAAKLDPIHKAVATTKSALAAFDVQQAEGMARYAQGLTMGRPTSAGARRAELVAEVADAEQASTAASAAQEGFRESAVQHGAPVKRIKADIASAVKMVMIEEAELLLAKVTAAIAAAEDAHREVLAASDAILDGLDSTSNDVSHAFAAFGNARREAEARPFAPDVNPHARGWKKLATALLGDASISFEDAASLYLPDSHAMTPYDSGAQMAAQVAAVLSFPTNSLT